MNGRGAGEEQPTGTSRASATTARTPITLKAPRDRDHRHARIGVVARAPPDRRPGVSPGASLDLRPDVTSDTSLGLRPDVTPGASLDLRPGGASDTPLDL
ncbi:hypothetical protein CA984_40290 [Streptosporangium minutum]|uniref:Uncharacterized protein n=1 Tax=Streptosporangium minutum TaxID=569862 RepID=A0A243QPY1_9ACTN|nr:hypothetical protein CA984_40290 [Streptosporangium minutum]